MKADASPAAQLPKDVREKVLDKGGEKRSRVFEIFLAVLAVGGTFGGSFVGAWLGNRGVIESLKVQLRHQDRMRYQ